MKSNRRSPKPNKSIKELRRLLNDSGGVLDKAKWFQAYWNRTVVRPDGFPLIEANPALTEPDEPRTTIMKRLVVSGG